MQAKKKRKAARPRRPAGPTIGEVAGRVEQLETTVARLVEVAERHGDEVVPKPQPEVAPATA